MAPSFHAIRWFRLAAAAMILIAAGTWARAEEPVTVGSEPAPVIGDMNSHGTLRVAKPGGTLSGGAVTSRATTTTNAGGRKSSKISLAAGTPDMVVTLTGSTQPVTSYSFGTVTVGKTAARSVTISNAGSVNLTVKQVYSGGSGFAVTPVNTTLSTDDWVLGAGQTQTLTVSFTPTAVTNYSGSFTIVSDDPQDPLYTVTVNGEGAAPAVPDVDLSSSATASGLSSIAFGQIATGGTATRTVSITNRGTASLTISSIVASGPLAIGSGPGTTAWNLAPGTSRNFTVTYQPSSGGSHTGTMVVQSNDPDEAEYEVALSGTAVTNSVPDIDVIGPGNTGGTVRYDFGQLVLKSAKTITFTLTNRGSADLVVSSVTGEAACFQMSPDNLSTSSSDDWRIAPGKQKTLYFTFVPLSVRSYSTTLSVKSNDPDEATYNIAITGSGVTSLTTDPGTTDPGTTDPGTTDPGTADPGTTDPGTTDPGTTDPGTGTTSSADIDVSAPGTSGGTTSYSFGSRVVNTAETIAFTVWNKGASDLVVSSVNGEVVGFQVSPDNSGASSADDWRIPAGKQKLIYFTFVPLSARTYNTTLALASNDPDEATYTVAITGTGIVAPSTTDPGTTDPGTTDPGTTDPGTTDPGTTDPGTTDPGTTDPGTTDPGTTDPGTTDPGTTIDVGDGPLGPVPSTGLRMGMNLMGVTDWNREWPFADAFKHSRGWIATSTSGSWLSGSVNVDASGWPILGDGQGAGTLMFREINGYYPAGTYVCTFEGDGDIAFSFDVKQVVRKTANRYEVTVQPSHSGIFLNVIRSNPNNRVRNIKFWMPGRENSGSLFHPLFVQRLRFFQVLRFMDWQQTNGSGLVNWPDRAKPTDARQSSDKGVAYEHIIELCNEVGADPWICVPHQASDDYIRQMATMFKNMLKPGLKVYLEYSNEIWNAGFGQNKWLEARTGTWTEAAAERLANTFRIWTEVWGDQSSRLVRIVGAQKNNLWIGQALADELYKKHGPCFDAITCSGYIGPGHTVIATYTSATTADNVIADTLVYTRDDNVPKQIKGHADLCKQYSTLFGRKVRFLVYEGGQHISLDGVGSKPYAEAFYGTQTHPGIYGAYHMMMKGFKDYGGDLFCAYAYASPTRSKYGSWGHLDHQDENASTAPKWQALLDGRNGKWFYRYNSSGLASTLSSVTGMPLSAEATVQDPVMTASFD